MYTLTRKLSVVCLTVVLSFLAYGCGGGSKQAVITDVSTDMVTAGLTPDSGTYIIQPGGTATAGDVTFTCPAEGSSCEVTVADDGTVTSTGGMATAMDSASALARLAAEEERDAANAAAMVAEEERDTANAATMVAEEARDTANAAAMVAEEERDTANAATMVAEEARDTANAATMVAEEARDTANAATMVAEEARDTANAAAMLDAAARLEAEAAAMVAEEARDAALAAAMVAEGERDAANAAAMVAEGERDAANAAAMVAEEERDTANAATMVAEEARDTANAATMVAEEARDTANAAAMLDAAARLEAEAAAMVAEEARDAALAAAMVAGVERDAALAAAMVAGVERDTAEAAAMVSEGERDTALAAAMVSEGERDTALAAAMVAEGERDTALAAAMVAEGERDTALTAAMVAEGERDTALTAAMVAEGERDTALTAAMVAGVERDTALTAAMVAEGERDTALTAAMVAEGERDTALTAAMVAEGERDDAIELARQLTVVTQIKTDLATGFDKVTAGTYPLLSGGFMELDDVRIECPVGIPCTVVITVSSAGDASYTSLGGVATVVNTSAVVHTRMAIALTGENNEGLNAQSEEAPLDTPTDPIGVKRSPSGTTTITPVHVAAVDAMGDEVEYKSVSVDRDHRITGWIGQTLTRDDSVVATEDIDAVPATNMDEATFYTNIESAESGLLKYKAGQVPDPNEDVMVFAVDPGQDAEDFTDEFTGSYIRKIDGSRIHGTFECNADVCTDVVVPITTSDEGNLVLVTYLAAGWTFESDRNVPEGEIHDANYMYFGYWLKSPVVVSDISSNYQSATFSGGNALFEVEDALIDGTHALTAKYEGGAAGRYVTRDLRVKNGLVDPNSPGSHGRFTAKTTLTATFGMHPSFAESAQDVTPVVVSRQNVIQGTISDFKDGSIDLGFEVTLGVLDIEASEGGLGESGTATATFGQTGDNGPTTGIWSAEFYGANAATSATNPNVAVVNRTLPSGVAGEFEVGTDSTYTKVVGAFAAERTQ